MTNRKIFRKSGPRLRPRFGAAPWWVSFSILRAVKSVLLPDSQFECTPLSRRLFLAIVCKYDANYKNQKYINTITPPDEDRATATGDVRKIFEKIGRVVPEIRVTPLLGGIGCVRRDESVVQRMSAYVHSLMYHRSPGMDPETHCSWTNLCMPQAASRLSKLFCMAYCYAQLHTDRPVDKYWHIPAACVAKGCTYAAGVWQPNDTTFDCRLDTHTHPFNGPFPGLPR